MKTKQPVSKRKVIATILFALALVAMIVMITLIRENRRKYASLTKESTSHLSLVLDTPDDIFNYGDIIYDSYSRPEQLFSPETADEATIAVSDYITNLFFVRAYEGAGMTRTPRASKAAANLTEIQSLYGGEDALGGAFMYVDKRFDQYLGN